MQVETTADTVLVTLSVSNLETLVGLQWEVDKAEEGYAVTFPTLSRDTESGKLLIIQVEPDEYHYNQPERKNGITGGKRGKTYKEIRGT